MTGGVAIGNQIADRVLPLLFSVPRLSRRIHQWHRHPIVSGSTGTLNSAPDPSSGRKRAVGRRAGALHFDVSVFSFFANSGLAFIAPAQPAS